MANKRTALFIPLIMGLLFSSCEENVLEETIAESVTETQKAVGDPVIFTETFETPYPFYTVHGTEFSTDYSFSVVSTPVYKGIKVARFELRDSTAMVSQGTRAEVTIVRDSVKKEMWYSFAALFPADEYAIDSEKEIISQWHQANDEHLNEKSQSPASQLVVSNDRFVFDTGYNDAPVSNGVILESRKKIDLGEVTKDTWHEFVFHFIHSYQADGLVEIWHNGELVATVNGGNMYNNVSMPKWKIGIYKWKWNGNGTTDTHKRVLYFDNIKVGNSLATLSDMVPATSPATHDPTPDPITSLTLVNSHTDLDIREIRDGDTLSLSTLGTKKLSIRANNESATVGSVKFVLGGTKARVYADNVLPYALFGDDGNGNYYFGNYMLVGSYSLTATPYAEPKARGASGAPFTINFTIKP
jgi:hypothetical protein